MSKRHDGLKSRRLSVISYLWKQWMSFHKTLCWRKEQHTNRDLPWVSSFYLGLVTISSPNSSNTLDCVFFFLLCDNVSLVMSKRSNLLTKIVLWKWKGLWLEILGNLNTLQLILRKFAVSNSNLKFGYLKI